MELSTIKTMTKTRHKACYQTLAVFCLLFSVVSVVGCNESNTSSVHGVVTVGGEPVGYGSIRFAPESGPGYGTVIKDGSYSTERGVPGKATVTVTAMAKPDATATPEQIRAGGGMAEAGFTTIPADHPKQGQAIDIKSGANEVNFEF